MTTVSRRIVDELVHHVTEVFGVMGNGNAYFADAVARSALHWTSVRHESAAVAAADAYGRVSERIAVATTTYGPGFTNAITSLAESAMAGVPLLLVVGAAPGAGARACDVDQRAIAAAVGVETVVVDREHPAAQTRYAVALSVESRRPVVLAIPYDLAAAPCAEPPLAEPAPSRPVVEHLDLADLADLAAKLDGARRPLILAGRGAVLAGAGPAIEALAARLGAETATTLPASGLLSGPQHLGIAGGFGTVEAAAAMADADVVLALGAGLNAFTLRSGALPGAGALLAQVDVGSAPTHPGVGLFVAGDARRVTERLLAMMPARELRPPRAPVATSWPAPHSTAPADGLLDPRAVATALAGLLPADRVVVSDGGHFLGWAPMYWPIADVRRMHTVGTAFLTIGLGTASAVGAARAAPDSTVVLVTGDGGLLMGLADLESVVREVGSGVVVVFNDAAYGAELHQYGSVGLDTTPMVIPAVDFAALARSLGATATTVRALDDLSGLERWMARGARGVHLLDCRVSPTVVAPYMAEAVDQRLLNH